MQAQGTLWRETLCADSSRRAELLRVQLDGLSRAEGVYQESAWQSPVLYWIVSPEGKLRYGGECLQLSRRAIEHADRILDPHGVTQQPFFKVVRAGVLSKSLLQFLLSRWVILPV